ncbi:hypothetical protein CONPUDRAFT_165415 [Coniophora puteana RWD-64-598 SS2]|uniref:MYND-type domain-containing protein n=1 Tax=Coniophora puteana (strain RWD-64-598) TaxID=741705 RepID=A0A5M3MR35_CONPW|nr:uncharacterized protein CONPUDRAFT_165415 [Coniophora puteana RWD-64-598 SS2]EIW81204.1 hypothetical protein CONPUDRAFT_165415 [Coniophora puteana RWD-64-598 SS2]
MGKRTYSALSQPRLSMSELVCKTLDHEVTDMLIDKWLEHRNDAYWDWFQAVRERKHAANALRRQIVVWNKGEFVPENVFCRTVDTGRLIPLDRTWTTHVYHHKSMQDRKLSMMPVVFTMLPELMLLRGMHDHGCDDIYIIVTDMKRQEMDDVTEYFKLVCQQTIGRTCKPSMERKIQYEHMRLSHTLLKQRRTPCFPQIDIAFRSILYEKKPPFIILFSHQTTSYSQILFTHPLFVPCEDIFFDFPSGCPNPCCNDDCEMIRFPRRGVEGAAILSLKRGRGWGKKVKAKEMCNWIDCDVCFSEEIAHSNSSSEGSQTSGESVDTSLSGSNGLVCSKCRLVKYCCADHQRKDWEEHRRVCAKPAVTSVQESTV